MINVMDVKYLSGVSYAIMFRYIVSFMELIGFDSRHLLSTSYVRHYCFICKRCTLVYGSHYVIGAMSLVGIIITPEARGCQ